MADMTRLGLEFEADEIEKLVAKEARRRELEGDSGGVQEFYNDRVRPIYFDDPLTGSKKNTCLSTHTARLDAMPVSKHVSWYQPPADILAD